MVAFTAHYYGISPLVVEAWKTKDIYDWYNEAVAIEEQMYKSLKSGMDGK